MKNKTLRIVLAIVGGVVTVGSIVVALIHFWDDIKKLIPCDECCEELDEIDDFEDIVE